MNQSGLLLRVLCSRISRWVIIERFCPKCRHIKILYGIKLRHRIRIGRRLRPEGRGLATYCLAKCGGGKQHRDECRHQKFLKILQTVVQTSLPGRLFPHECAKVRCNLPQRVNSIFRGLEIADVNSERTRQPSECAWHRTFAICSGLDFPGGWGCLNFGGLPLLLG